MLISVHWHETKSLGMRINVLSLAYVCLFLSVLWEITRWIGCQLVSRCGSVRWCRSSRCGWIWMELKIFFSLHSGYRWLHFECGFVKRQKSHISCASGFQCNHFQLLKQYEYHRCILIFCPALSVMLTWCTFWISSLHTSNIFTSILYFLAGPFLPATSEFWLLPKPLIL